VRALQSLAAQCEFDGELITGRFFLPTAAGGPICVCAPPSAGTSWPGRPATAEVTVRAQRGYNLGLPGVGASAVRHARGGDRCPALAKPAPSETAGRSVRGRYLSCDERAQDNPPFCDDTTGANCVNPPNGAAFYPFFTTGNHNRTCTWQEGGNFIPGTIDHFGGSSTTEFGRLLETLYPNPGFTASSQIDNFNSGDVKNPCQSSLG
jgi:hypothetical protein